MHSLISMQLLEYRKEEMVREADFVYDKMRQLKRDIPSVVEPHKTPRSKRRL